MLRTPLGSDGSRDLAMAQVVKRRPSERDRRQMTIKRNRWNRNRWTNGIDFKSNEFVEIQMNVNFIKFNGSANLIGF